MSVLSSKQYDNKFKPKHFETNFGILNFFAELRQQQNHRVGKRGSYMRSSDYKIKISDSDFILSRRFNKLKFTAVQYS